MAGILCVGKVWEKLGNVGQIRDYIKDSLLIVMT